MANIGNASIRLMLKRLWRHLSKRRRQQFLLLLVLMIIASFAEILSIGAVLPFLATLTAPESVMSNPLAQPFIKMLSINEASELLLPMTVIFSVSILLAATIRLSMIWANTRLSFAAGADVSLDIYRRTLHQPYRVHISRNSSEIIDGITFKSNSMIYNAILPTLNMISASIMLTVILAGLVYMNPAMATSAFLGFGVIYLVIIRLTKTTQKKDSENIAHESVQVIKYLQEGLGGIRDVLLDASQNIYCKIYQKSDKSLRRAQGNNYFISQSPRYGMEALGMILIAGLAYYLTQQSDGIQTAIPLLGAFALGAQKLLPILQQVYSSWSSLRGGASSIARNACFVRSAC
ncbi:ABC transporter transmembrane domain-containing protein [Methylophilaceae bacterium]|nr:ABC transporter transmembrane domain-containing protein [Methylophilaceae bacterium]